MSKWAGASGARPLFFCSEKHGLIAVLRDQRVDRLGGFWYTGRHVCGRCAAERTARLRRNWAMLGPERGRGAWVCQGQAGLILRPLQAVKRRTLAMAIN